MKQYIYLFILGSSFFTMLLFPEATFRGALDGLLLWFQTVVPTILPFTIISNILLRSNCAFYISKILSPVLKSIFNISSSGCYAVFVGFLCGYPMGAKVISDLVNESQISRKEGQYLLSFCNNTSPIFITNYIVTQNFQKQSLLVPTLIILYLSPILCSFIFRKKYRFFISQSNNQRTPKLFFDFSLFDTSIMNGFETITKIGGYIIIFSIAFSLCRTIPFNWFLPFLEITNGIPFLLNGSLSFKYAYILSLALTSYGGLCSVFQTHSMIHNTGLSIRNYQKEKLITAMVTSLLAYVYIIS